MKQFARLIGSWVTEATHPMMPGVIVHGTVVVEWLEGEKFLLHRSRTDHPKFPDSLSVIGNDDQDREGQKPGDAVAMHYFDSRGVFRRYEATADEHAWRWWRNAPGFSQRFTGTFADGGNTIVGLCQLCTDDQTWVDDLMITYRRS